MTKENTNNISKGLLSKDNKVVLDSIQKIREEGNNSHILDISDLYSTTANNEIKEKIYSLLCDLRNRESAEAMITAISKAKNKETKKMLLAACWQSRLSFIDYLENFIDIVLKEEFELAFEAFTVIENIESKVTIERKNELIAYTEGKITILKEDSLNLAQDIIPIISNYEE